MQKHKYMNWDSLVW